MLFHMDLNIYAFVGLIMLIGIVEKNAIMQIDFALEAERNQGLTPMKAIYEGCLIRFRPIMMTTMAALLGAVPIALGYGAGGEARQPLGLVVVGGLLFSQLVTLYLTPVFYTYMAALQDRVQSWRGRGSSATPMMIPPTAAPRIESSPPRIMAGKASRAMLPRVASKVPELMAKKTPPMTAIAAEMPQARAYIVRMLMPIARAASWSSAVARMANP